MEEAPSLFSRGATVGRDEVLPRVTPSMEREADPGSSEANSSTCSTHSKACELWGESERNTVLVQDLLKRNKRNQENSVKILRAKGMEWVAPLQCNLPLASLLFLVVVCFSFRHWVLLNSRYVHSHHLLKARVSE